MTNELARGLTEAVTGAILAVTGKEADTDFLGPFLQAQQNRLARANQRESNAYSNYSNSSRASREAFQLDPTEGKYQAAMATAQKRLNLALDDTEHPAARQALTDMYQADAAFFKSKLDGGIIQRDVEAGRAGDFGFMKTAASEHLQPAIEALTQPGSVVAQNFGEYQILAERLAQASASTGDLPGGVGDSDRLQGVNVDPGLQSTLDLVQETGGSLSTWAIQNPEQGQNLLTALSTTNPQAIQGVHRGLEKQERTVELRGKLRQLGKSSSARTAALYDPSIYTTDAEGRTTIKESRRDDVIRLVNQEHLYAGDADAEFRSLEASGIDVSYERRIAVPRELVRQPSSNLVGKVLEDSFDSSISLYDSGALQSLATDLPFRTMVQRGQEQRALQHLVEKGVADPQQAFKLFREGPKAIMSGLIDTALGQESYIEGERARINDKLAIAQANGDAVGIQAANKELTSLGDFTAGADFRTIKDMQESAFEAAGRNDPDFYRASVLQYLETPQQGSLLTGEDGQLSAAFEKRIKEIQDLDSALDRHKQFGELLVGVGLSKESNVSPDRAAARDRARLVALDLNERMVRAIPQATGRPGLLKTAGGEVDPIDAAYSLFSSGDIDEVLRRIPATAAERAEAAAAAPTPQSLEQQAQRF